MLWFISSKRGQRIGTACEWVKSKINIRDTGDVGEERRFAYTRCGRTRQYIRVPSLPHHYCIPRILVEPVQTSSNISSISLCILNFKTLLRVAAFVFTTKTRASTLPRCHNIFIEKSAVTLVRYKNKDKSRIHNCFMCFNNF